MLLTALEAMGRGRVMHTRRVSVRGGCYHEQVPVVGIYAPTAPT